MTDFAPQYTRAERIALLLRHLAWAVPLLLVAQFGFFPWFRQYAETAHCQWYGSFGGLHLVFYGVFAGIPLFCALLLLALEGRRSLAILRLGQSPLPGEKTLRPTRYRRGLRARLQVALLLATVLALLGLTLYGAHAAQAIIALQDAAELPACRNAQP